MLKLSAVGVEPVVRGPINPAIIGVPLQRLHLCIRLPLAGENFRAGQGLQGKPAEVARFISVRPLGAVNDAIEVPLAVTGQGVGLHANLANVLYVGSHPVHGIELAFLGHAVQGIVCPAEGQVGQLEAHSAHIDHVGRMLGVDDIQVTCIGSGIHEAVDVRGRIKGFFRSQDAQHGLLRRGVVHMSQVFSKVKTDQLVAEELKGKRLGWLGLRSQGKLYLIGGCVARIVTHFQPEMLAVDLGQVQLEGGGLPSRLLVGASDGQGVEAAGGTQRHTGDVLVVLCRDSHGVADQVVGDFQNFRRGVINGQRNRSDRALAQGVPVCGAVFVDIQLRGQLQGELQMRPLREAFALVFHRELHGGIAPHPYRGHIEGSQDRAQLLLLEDLLGVGVADGNSGIAHIADERQGPGVQQVAPQVVHGVPLRHVNGIGNHAVATHVILRTGISLGPLQQGVSKGSYIKLFYILSGFKGLVRTHIQHGGVGPVAVEAQKGDGVGGQNQPFGSGGGGGIDEALYISAVGEVPVQLCLLAVGETHLHSDSHAAGGRHGDHAGIQHLQKRMYIIRGDCAVFIQVGGSLICGELRPQDHMVHEELGVCVIGHAVAVEIIVGQVPDRGNCLPVYQEGDLSVHGLGEGVHIEPQLRLVFVNVIFKYPLGEEISGEGIGGVLAPQIVEGEGEGVDAGPVRIVLQLCLHLAVRLAIYQDVGGSADRLVHRGQTCALAEDGVIVAGGLLEHGLRSGHEEALGQGPVGEARLAQLLLLQVLLYEGGQTRHLGRRHGGTGHVGISIGLKHGPLQGIDAAARGRDFRLHAQVAGDAPGAEGAHGEILGVFIICNNFAMYCNGTRIVG